MPARAGAVALLTASHGGVLIERVVESGDPNVQDCDPQFGCTRVDVLGKGGYASSLWSPFLTQPSKSCRGLRADTRIGVAWPHGTGLRLILICPGSRRINRPQSEPPFGVQECMPFHITRNLTASEAANYFRKAMSEIQRDLL
jgi:hypothetical protein